MGMRTEHTGQCGQNRNQEPVKVGAGTSGARSRERISKRLTLVGNVQEYWGFYDGEGANPVYVL